MPKGAYANLDFLRAVAVLLVLAQHLCRRVHIEHIFWAPTSSLGLFGVLLFFVHTSLVLMWSMERSHLSGVFLLRDFYIRRIFRIYPLSILAIASAVALHLDSDINGVAGLSYGALPGKLALLSQVLLVQNLVPVKSIVNVLWSLPFEVQMYLFLPFPEGAPAPGERKQVLCLVLGLLIPFFGEIQSKSICTISNRIATYSYGIYVSHQFCIWFALGVLAARPLWFRLGLLATMLVVVPILLYHGLEKPMIQLGIRMVAGFGGKKAAATPAVAP